MNHRNWIIAVLGILVVLAACDENKLSSSDTDSLEGEGTKCYPGGVESYGAEKRHSGQAEREKKRSALAVVRLPISSGVEPLISARHSATCGTNAGWLR